MVSGYFGTNFIVLLEAAINVPTEIQILDFSNKWDANSGTTLKLNGHNNQQYTSCGALGSVVVKALRY